MLYTPDALPYKEISRRQRRHAARTSAQSRPTMTRDDDDKRSLSPLILDDSLSSSPHLDSPRYGPVRFASSRRRRIVVTAVAIFSVFSLLGLAYLSSSRPLLVSQDPVLSSDHTPPVDRKSVLHGPPTSRFRGSPQIFSTIFPPS